MQLFTTEKNYIEKCWLTEPKWRKTLEIWKGVCDVLIIDQVLSSQPTKIFGQNEILHF